DALAELIRAERTNEGKAVVPQAHELHPQALRYACAVAPVLRDLRLIPGACPRLPGLDLADASAEAALLRLDEMAHHLIRAPFVRIEVPGGVVAERDQLRFDEI